MINLASLLSDHMVLQQGRDIAVWGTCAPGQSIRASIGGRSASVVADAAGNWTLHLPALDAGGPYEMTVEGDGSTLVLTDILIGEVWVCSGQSNMEMGIEAVENAEAEIASANQPLIRLFTVPKCISMEPQEALGGSWLACTPDTIRNGDWGGFSATAYFFGRKLAEELKIPIGLIHSSWGGTVAEAWTRRETLLQSPELRPLVEKFDDDLAHYDERLALYSAEVKERDAVIEIPDEVNAGLERGWAARSLDTKDWRTMKLPRLWQAEGLSFSGVLWFRKTVVLPDDWAGDDLTLAIGSCDKDDITYFNGERVGGISHGDNALSWCTPRVYRVPGHLVHAGENVIAVRVFSHIYDGGMRGPASDMYVAPVGAPFPARIPIHGEWLYEIEQNFGNRALVTGPTTNPAPMGPGNPNSCSGLYNGMIHPLRKAAIRGAIWYQGESNSSRAAQYRTLFPVMIQDWRGVWNDPEMPFLFVQLASYNAGGVEAGCWPELREAQMMALKLPATGMAVAADIGLPNDVHPTNKQDVGLRLALNALAKVYARAGVIYSGPILRSFDVSGRVLSLAFNFAEGGLEAHGPLTGFEIAGGDGVYAAADATIVRDTVLLSSAAVSAPVSARYAWEDNPVCSLYNGAGLPAPPFRTNPPAAV